MVDAALDRRKVQDWVNLVLAVVLFISPWVLGFVPAATAAWNAWAVAIVIGVLAIAAITAFAVWEEWINLLLGLWLIVSPWVLHFSTDTRPTWTFVVLGIIAAVISAWALWENQHGTHAHA
ncbi:MAG: SPW repeat protein [Mesorhizobium sp.]